MSIFSYHLTKVSLLTALPLCLCPPKAKNIPGLVHADTMHSMILGSPVVSPARFLIRQLVVFVQGKNKGTRLALPPGITQFQHSN